MATKADNFRIFPEARPVDFRKDLSALATEVTEHLYRDPSDHALHAFWCYSDFANEFGVMPTLGSVARVTLSIIQGPLELMAGAPNCCCPGGFPSKWHTHPRREAAQPLRPHNECVLGHFIPEKGSAHQAVGSNIHKREESPKIYARVRRKSGSP